MPSSDSDIAASPERIVVSPARFHHVGIKTRQLDEMVSFYEKLLGVEPVAQLPFAVFMTYDGNAANHRIVLFNSDDFQQGAGAKGIGLQHLAYEYDSLDDLLNNYLAFKDLGLEPVWVTDHGPTISFYYHDPDENLIELQVDNFGAAELSKEFMESEVFTSNPLGFDIDAEKLLAAHREGASGAEIHERAYVGEFVPEGGPTGPPGL